MTHGPAIHNRDDPPPQRRPAISTGRMDRPSWLLRRAKARGSGGGRVVGRGGRKRHRRRGASQSPPAAGRKKNTRVANQYGASVPRGDSIPTHGLPPGPPTRKNDFRFFFKFSSRRRIIATPRRF